MGLFDFLRDDDSAGGGGTDGVEGGRVEGDSPPTPLAESLAEDADEHVLDFSPESLRRLDRYVDTLDPAEREQRRDAVAAYVGEVFVRNYEATWQPFDDLGWVVYVPDPDSAERMVLPLPDVVEDCLSGGATFAVAHDGVLSELGVEGPQVASAPSGGPPEDPLPAAAVDVRADRAEGLAEEWPGYDLDFSPASLARLDDLVADEYDQSPGDVDRDELAAESPHGGVPEGANLRIGSGGAAGRMAAYVGEVYRRTYGAEWYDGDGFDVLVLEGDQGTVELEPAMLVSASLAGHVSFERLHGALDEQVGLAA